MLKFLKPTKYVEKMNDLNFEEFYKDGFKAILFDIDNTLVLHGKPSNEDTKKFINYLKNIGFEIIVVSNNIEKRVRPFANDLNIKLVYNANKPMKTGYQKALKQLNLTNKEVIFIGDQLFTDIWGANRMNIYSILVKPISKKEPINVKIKRLLEILILKIIYK